MNVSSLGHQITGKRSENLPYILNAKDARTLAGAFSQKALMGFQEKRFKKE
jgi:hypothetical protein